ncbi:MAG: hypothetical protein IJF33_03185 [Clostridia bacterium]|nr:hypothetical protein [Clostridia bacterium]
MKRIFTIFLVIFMIMACFSACVSVETNPNGKETVSESNAESVSDTATEPTREIIAYAQEDIPGDRLDFTLLYKQSQFDVPSLDKYGSFLVLQSKEAFEGALPFLDAEHALLQAIAQVDFETHCVLLVETQVASLDNPFVLDEIVIQEGRVVFVFHSDMKMLSNGEMLPHLSVALIEKNMIPQDVSDCFVCAYSTNDPYYSVDDVIVPVGSYHYPNYYEYR